MDRRPVRQAATEGPNFPKKKLRQKWQQVAAGDHGMFYLLPKREQRKGLGYDLDRDGVLHRYRADVVLDSPLYGRDELAGDTAGDTVDYRRVDCVGGVDGDGR
jgi:hypothetical protein